MRQPQEPDGPHRLQHSYQERCTVEGRLIDGSGVCTIVTIHDRRRRSWVLYPYGTASLGVLITEDAARTLAEHLWNPL